MHFVFFGPMLTSSWQRLFLLLLLKFQPVEPHKAQKLRANAAKRAEVSCLCKNKLIDFEYFAMFCFVRTLDRLPVKVSTGKKFVFASSACKTILYHRIGIHRYYKRHNGKSVGIIKDLYLHVSWLIISKFSRTSGRGADLFVWHYRTVLLDSEKKMT